MHLNLSDLSLDPFAREALEATEAVARARAQRGQLDLKSEQGLKAARDIESYGTPLGTSTDSDIEYITIATGGLAVPARVIRPATAVEAVYLDIHGGGFYCGSPRMDDARNVAYSNGMGAVVVSVDYRLAPECPWPAALDDCEAATRWLLKYSVELFGTSNVFIGGASAGANLAAATMLRLRDRPPASGRISAANLLYGAYDLSGLSPTGRIHWESSAEICEAYVGHISDRSEPTISPLYGNLSGLPPAIFSVGAMDERFYEENTAMAMRWAAAGNVSHLNVYPGSGHGFDHLPTKMAEIATCRTVEWLLGHLSS